MLKLYVTICHSSLCSYPQHSEWEEMQSLAFLLNAKDWKGVPIYEGDVLGCCDVNEGSGEAALRSGLGNWRRSNAGKGIFYKYPSRGVSSSHSHGESGRKGW